MMGRARPLAWSLSAVAMMLFAVGVGLSAAGTSSDGPHLGTTGVLFFAVALTYAVVGAVVASRRPSNPIGWLMLTEGLLFQLVCFSIGYTHYAVYAEPGRLRGGAMVAWAGNVTWIPILVVASLVLMIFPTGRLRSARWRPVGLHPSS